MMNHDRIEELLAAQALDGLDAGEREELARERAAHGVDCAECAALEREFSEVAGLLALSLPPAPVTVPDLRAAPAAAATEASGPKTRTTRWLAVAAAFVLLVVGAGAGYLLAQARHGNSQGELAAYLAAPETRFLPFRSDGGSGHLLLASDPSAPDAYVLGGNVGTPAAGETYQLWTIKGKTPIPGPTFQPAAGRVVVHLDTSLSGASAVAVTVEPSGGSQAPTTTPIFVAPVVG
jgi:anti-sigma-K factor RskA